MKPALTALLLVIPCFVAACGSDGGPTRPRDGGGVVDGATLDGSAPGDQGTGRDTGVGRDAGPTCAGGTLCGTPVVCCPAGNECVGGACLPACATGVRCGADSSVCCGEGQLCLSNACATPTTSCGDSYDCQPGEFCEPTLGRCLPQPPGGPACVYSPSFTTLEPSIERSWETEEIISIPVVADLDADGTPEIVVNATQQDGAGFPGGRIVVLDGASPGTTFAEDVAPIPHNPPLSYGSHGRTTVAVGDVSGDGRPDIVYLARSASSRSLVVAIGLDDQGDPELHWTSFARPTMGDSPTPYGAAATADNANGAITLANFDDDPMAEVVVGAMIFDHDGRLIWDAGTNGSGANFGTNSGYNGGIAVVADLDDDGAPELISGRHAFKVAWTQASGGTLASAVVTPYWTYAGSDGYPAVADLDMNGAPEVVLVASNQVILINGQTGELWCVAPGQCSAPLAIPGGASSNRGGPPTIADFDGDGRPEVGVAGGHSYSVYDVHRPGEDLVYPGANPAPAAGALYVRWSSATQDTSSNATGSSVFDFQGDGAAEVVYADECFLRVYSGTDGQLQLEQPSTSATIHEYPLVVDADGDGNSEILLVTNDTNSAGNCGAVPSRRGLFMYGDANDAWVPTRRVWTQHAYHVTNATSAGNVPMSEQRNWLQPGLNNARQNVQGDGVFNAPDVAVDLSVGLAACPTSHQLLARVTNLGALGVYMGVPVRFERTTGGTTEFLGTAFTTMPLLPGQSEVLTFDAPALEGQQDYRVIVDDDQGGTVEDFVNECNEDNNTSAASGAGCVIFG